MSFLPWILPILLFFRPEIFHFFINLTLLQQIILLVIISICLLIFRNKIRDLITKTIDLFKNLDFKKYKRRLLKWAKKNDSNQIGNLILTRLQRNVFINLGCFIFSATILSHYPKLWINPSPVSFFLFTLIIYTFTNLALKKEILIITIGTYILIAFSPYLFALVSLFMKANIFETLPSELISFLNLDIYNLTQTANQLFLYIAPWSLLIILFFVLSSIIIRNLINLMFTSFIKILQSL